MYHKWGIRAGSAFQATISLTTFIQPSDLPQPPQPPPAYRVSRDRCNWIASISRYHYTCSARPLIPTVSADGPGLSLGGMLRYSLPSHHSYSTYLVPYYSTSRKHASTIHPSSLGFNRHSNSYPPLCSLPSSFLPSFLHPQSLS